MKKLIKLSAAVFVFLISLSLAHSVFANYTWTETSSGAKVWKMVKITPDASKAFAITNTPNDYVYASFDGGTNWNPLTAGQAKWGAVAVSSNGQNVIAAADNGTIYYSTNAGSDWNTSDAPVMSWNSVSLSSNGQYAIASAWGQILYISIDGGVHWTASNSTSDQWTAVTSSSDGSKAAAAAYNGSLFTSTDNGLNWTNNSNSSGSSCWSYMSATDNFNKIAVGNCPNGPIKVSTNNGVSWDSLNSGNGDWYSVGISSDGQVIAGANHNNGYITISTDGGNTWNEQNLPGQHSWTYVAISSDGSKIFASAENNNIYTAVVTVTPPPAIVVTIPTLATSTPTNISTTSITLNASIQNDGNASTSITGFNWGLDTNYGNTASSSNILGTGQNFSETISGLTCATLYHYNAFAVNATGTSATLDNVFNTDICPIIATSTPDDTGSTTPPDNSTSTPPTSTSTPNDTVSTTTNTDRTYSSSGSRMIFFPVSGGSSASSDNSQTCITISGKLRLGSQGEEVTKLQQLLNKFTDTKLVVSGNYDEATREAVKVFQLKYSNDILAPWGVTEPSGIVLFTTSKKLNELSCGKEFPLSSLEAYFIKQYREAPITTPQSTTTPIEIGKDTTKPDANADQTAGAANAVPKINLFKKIGNFFKNIF